MLVTYSTEFASRRFLCHLNDWAAWNSKTVVTTSPAFVPFIKHALPAEP